VQRCTTAGEQVSGFSAVSALSAACWCRVPPCVAVEKKSGTFCTGSRVNADGLTSCAKYSGHVKARHPLRLLAAIAALLALGTLPACATLAAAKRSDATAACVGERWLTPRELRTKEGYTVYLERPSVVAMRGVTFLVASPTLTLDSTGKIVWPLASSSVPTLPDDAAMGVLVRRDGLARLVPVPKGLVSFPWMPQAVADSGGIAHVVWGSDENDPLPTHASSRSLWSARFDGARWSTPTRLIVTDGLILWMSANASPLVAKDGAVHLMVAVRGEGLRYFRFEHGTWIDRHVDISSALMGYPHLALLRSHRIVLMVQGALQGPPRVYTAGFFATWSDDDGVHWAPPAPISRFADGPAYDGQLLVDDHDVLHAFWYQQTDPAGNPATRLSLGGSPGRVYASRSTDGGRTWEPATATPVIENANELGALLRRDRSVLAVVGDRRGERTLLTTWSSGWSPFAILEAKPDPFNPSLGTDDAQRPFLVWGIQHERGWPGSMATELVPCR